MRFVREHAREHAQEPFFLYVAYTAAHWPMHAKRATSPNTAANTRRAYEPIREARWERQKQLGLIDARWTPSPLAGDWSNGEGPGV